MLLEGLTTNVKRQIVGVHNSSDEIEVARKQLIKLVGDEHLSHVQLQSPVLLLCNVTPRAYVDSSCGEGVCYSVKKGAL